MVNQMPKDTETKDNENLRTLKFQEITAYTRQEFKNSFIQALSEYATLQKNPDLEHWTNRESSRAAMQSTLEQFHLWDIPGTRAIRSDQTIHKILYYAISFASRGVMSPDGWLSKRYIEPYKNQLDEGQQVTFSENFKAIQAGIVPDALGETIIIPAQGDQKKNNIDSWWRRYFLVYSRVPKMPRR